MTNTTAARPPAKGATGNVTRAAATCVVVDSVTSLGDVITSCVDDEEGDGAGWVGAVYE